MSIIKRQGMGEYKRLRERESEREREREREREICYHKEKKFVRVCV